MKNPIQTKKVHKVSEDLNSMQTVTTVSLFGVPICRTRQNQNISISFFQ